MSKDWRVKYIAIIGKEEHIYQDATESPSHILAGNPLRRTVPDTPFKANICSYIVNGIINQQWYTWYNKYVCAAISQTLV